MIKTKTSMLVAVALLLVGLAAGWWINGHRIGTQLATLQAEHATHLATQQAASADVISRTLLRERQLHKDIEEIQENAETEQKRITADLSDSNAAARGLRNQLDRISGRISADTATVAECKAARATAGLLAELLAESDQLAGVFAETAGRSRIAGLTCESEHDAVVKQSRGD